MVWGSLLLLLLLCLFFLFVVGRVGIWVLGVIYVRLRASSHCNRRKMCKFSEEFQHFIHYQGSLPQLFLKTWNEHIHALAQAIPGRFGRALFGRTLLRFGSPVLGDGLRGGAFVHRSS